MQTVSYFGGIVSPIHEVATASEGDKLFNLPTGTVKRDCNIGRKFKHYEVRKSGKIWLISISALEREYKLKRSEKV
ncbi:hypothetical protein BKP45_05045 [Anaerobacillus alkalidiazotrophicus]|uniref:Helix-turn-helix domain-containing protein n=1 Tax=Anaerobacillus alkalidiazotrophicus TaxID=472963 RepID=A0A1S2MED5_9BACI|nr:helix-turn-helix domain-containing protein [Anaerobacillus alkalidiazotrophicus]OIJ22045.1 hypothetical protein BKP45_05045 [Anaerobacillus alkalidiazotrophicus]